MSCAARRCKSIPANTLGWWAATASGKTTIFRLINNEEQPDRGDVIRARGTRLGLLSQHVHFEAGSTVHESALAAFGHLQQIEHEMHELEHRMAEAVDDLDQIPRTLQRFAASVRTGRRL